MDSQAAKTRPEQLPRGAPDMARRRGKRGLEPGEHELWKKVTQAVKPLDDRAAMADLLKADVPRPKPQKANARPAKAAAHPASPVLPAPAHKRPKPPPAPQDSGTLDGGLQRKLRRGRIEPDAKIDLHGLNQAQAHVRLKKDLPRLRAQGVRCLLVVTGKGSASTLARHTLHGDSISHTPERRGVLRDNLPRWLGEAEFRPHVAALRPAHPRHGGGGAFYVWLRRNR